MRRSRRVAVIATGMRPPDFLDRRTARGILDLPHQALVAGVVGRVEPDKGGADAITAALRLAAVAPGAVVAFLGASEAGSGYRAGLERQAERLGVTASVRFLGERPDAVRLFRAFDLLLHPSRHEALPRVLIEALWAGVPAAAYAVGGVVEVVGTGVDAGGLLAPPDRPTAFVRLAERLALDPDLRRALAAAGTHRAAARFSLETMAVAVVGEYDALLSGSALTGLPALPEAA
jgi:glycosyltransferase involved in cell wall biosynthesis